MSKYVLPDYLNLKKPTSSNPQKRKNRICMMCRKEFMSEGIGHRICDKCKTTSDYKQGVDTYKIGR